jgi:hypothetical protein
MRPALTAAIGLLLLLTGPAAQAQHTLEIVEQNGPSDNRIDLLLMGDGFTADEQDDLVTNTDEALERLFDKIPFDIYRSFFNLARIATVSSESGADHPAENVYVDSYFDCYYDCYDIDRLICCDTATIMLVAADLYPEFDYVLMVVNDPEYGGSGGAVAVTSTSPDSFDVPPHELGHTIAALGDEYDEPIPDWECQDVWPNVSPTYELDELKWSYWVEDGTPLPTPESAAVSDLEPIGAYEGACYEETDWYRPVLTCLMRELDSELCSVCAEVMVLAYYGFVEPIDSLVPSGDTVTAAAGEVVEFLVETVEPEPSATVVAWLVDQQELVQDDPKTISIAVECLDPGEHTVEVTVNDETELVRSDPQQLTRQSHTWELIRTDDGPTAECEDLQPLPGSEPTVDAAPPGAITASSAGCGCDQPGPRHRRAVGSLTALLLIFFG